MYSQEVIDHLVNVVTTLLYEKETRLRQELAGVQHDRRLIDQIRDDQAAGQ